MNIGTLLEELPGKVAGAVTAALRPPAGAAAQPAVTSVPVRRQAPKSDEDSGVLDQINAISDPLARAKFIASHRQEISAQRNRQLRN